MYEEFPQNTLDQHHLTVKEDHKCEICGELFKNKLTLKIHFAAFHGGGGNYGKQFNCDWYITCGMCFC